MKFTPQEVFDLAKAWIGVTLAFEGGMFLLGSFNFQRLLLTFMVVGGAVILHELAHKQMAVRLGEKATFQSNDKLLLFGVILAVLTGFIFLAPGAVHLKRVVSPTKNALIAWAGPAMNGLLAILALPLTYVDTTMQSWFTVTVFINSFLGIFNMIPFPGFDGQKIIKGDKLLYWGTLAALIILLASTFA